MEKCSITIKDIFILHCILLWLRNLQIYRPMQLHRFNVERVQYRFLIWSFDFRTLFLSASIYKCFIRNYKCKIMYRPFVYFLYYILKDNTANWCYNKTILLKKDLTSIVNQYIYSSIPYKENLFTPYKNKIYECLKTKTYCSERIDTFILITTGKSSEAVKRTEDFSVKKMAMRL